MIIKNSNVAMTSSHTKVSGQSQSFVGTYYKTSDKASSNTRSNNNFAALYTNIAETKSSDSNGAIPTSTYSKTFNQKDTIQDMFDDIKASSSVSDDSLNVKDSTRIQFQTISWILRVLFYHEKAGKIQDMDDYDWSGVVDSQNQLSSYLNSFNSNDFSSSFFSMEETNYSYEAESTSYSASGSVVCADGREIDFNLEFSLSRSFESYSQVNISQALKMMDPLVINLDSNPTEVSDQKFYFDLDCDGKEEELNNISEGSAFLAIDLNKDGIINDGSELFGTKSGNGFYDLSQYDSDSNGWIDEADDVFSSLKVVSFNSDGSQSIMSLSQADVGAICLQNLSTDYSFTDKENSSLGQMTSSGIFLHESGGVGSISNVDLAVG